MEAHAEAFSESAIRRAIAMILVMLGTNPYPFRRLLSAADSWASYTGEKVVAQTGHTPTDGITIECTDFISHAKMMNLIADAELVICQGGFGSLRDSLSVGKPVIAVPRMPELGECIDSQSEIVEALAERNRVIPLHDVSMLADAVFAARQFCAPVPTCSGLPDLVAEIVSGMRADG